METSFKHYLITRYNVPLTGWEADKRGVSTRDEEWLTHRYRLFSQYCLPSVLAQSNTEFEWLIYMDAETPGKHRDALHRLVGPHTHISLRPTTGYYECLADINHTLQQAGAAFVLTSRLDNDDALGIDYIHTMQRAFRPQHGLLINILNGHGYDTIRQVGMRLRNIRQNSFMSLVEKCNPEGNHISIRGFQHDQPPDRFTTVNVRHDYGWLKLFHDRNLKSEAFGMPVWNNDFAKHYGLASTALPINTGNRMRYLLWWMRDGVVRKWRKARKKINL